jgi:FkbM family methyltransferase
MSFPSYALREYARSLFCAVAHFRHPWEVFRVLHGGSLSRHLITLRSGPALVLRSPGSRQVCDLNILVENLLDDQYELGTMMRDGDIVVDIGAHIGIFSVLAACRRSNICVFAFEPERDNFATLRENIAANPNLNIEAYNKAVSYGGSSGSLYLSDSNTGAHSLVWGEGRAQAVECIDLSAVLSLLPERRIDLLKVDCEGGEYNIFLNADATDLSCVRRIVMEIHEPENAKEFRAEQVIGRLTSGFDVRTIKTIVYRGESVCHLITATRRD